MNKKILLVVAVMIFIQLTCPIGGGDGWNGAETECAQAAEAAGYGDFETRMVGGICQVNAGRVPGRDIWVDLAAMPRRTE